jgi:hypothetical protein
MLIAKHYFVDQIKKREMGGHVARMDRIYFRTGIWWGDLKEIGSFEDLHVHERLQ